MGDNALSNLPPVPAWAVYLFLGLAGIGGLSGTSSLVIPFIAPQPDVSAEVEKLKRDVGATAEAVDALKTAVDTQTATFNTHVAKDTARDLQAADMERRLDATERRQQIVEEALSELRVNQRVICQALKAPCVIPR